MREKIEADVHRAKEELKAHYFDDAFEKLSTKRQEEITETVNLQLARLSAELETSNPRSRLKELAYHRIFGTDANPRMARTAKMNMIMHGDGHNGVHHHDGLLNVNGIFDGRFDVILTNPPFGARVDKGLKVTKGDVPEDAIKLKAYEDRYPGYHDAVVKPLQQWAEKNCSILDLFSLGKMSGLTEVLFIERCLNLLRSGGRMGILLPEGVLNNNALQRVREFVEGRAKIINITSIPQDVFLASGATVKPSLLFLKKFTDEEAAEWTQLMNDATAEAAKIYGPQRTALAEEYDADIEALRARGAGKVDLDARKKVLRTAMQAIHRAEETWIRREVKRSFDYQVPVAAVDKAGITSTGAKCDNELEAVAKEFAAYRKEAKLWEARRTPVQYKVREDGHITREWVVGEEEIFYEA